ncbi:MAG: hypothetical protein WCO79_03005 [bacterium]
MTTPYVVKKSVAKRKPTLDEVLTYMSRISDLGRRFTEGSLHPTSVLDTLQCMQEGWGIGSGMEEVPAEQVSRGRIIPLFAHQPRPMSELFRNGDGVEYSHRDGDFDRLFTANSPECLAGTARLVKTPKAMKFKQMAQWVTGLQTESVADLARAIVAQNLDLTPAQWDDQIVATQAGQDILLTNTWASFAFAKTGKKLKDEQGQEYDEVVVLGADRSGGGRWHADVDGLDYGSEWDADSRLLLRNSP